MDCTVPLSVKSADAAGEKAPILAPWQPIMQRSWSLVAVLVGTVALLVLLRMGAQRALDDFTNPQPLTTTGGRVQLVIDEKDVGAVREGTKLEVRFAVANTGTETLVLRQAPRECCSDEVTPTYSIEPRQTGEITALLSAEDLIDRGRKHIRFFTSDATNPELWVTVRGTVHRRPADDEDEEERYERSVLVRPQP